MSYNIFVGSINNLEIAMTNSEVYEMFASATNDYVEKLREIKDLDMIRSIDILGLIAQLHDEIWEVESELLDEEDLEDEDEDEDE